MLQAPADGSKLFRHTLEQLSARHSFIHAGRRQTNGTVESLHRTILEECWRPSHARSLHMRFTGLRRDLEQYLRYHNLDRTHEWSRGRIRAEMSTVPAG